MKKSLGSLLFCLLFCLICILPLAGMLIFGPSEAGSNEVLAKAPALREKDGSWNVEYLNDLSAYVRDRFGFRQELITAHAELTAAIFAESATEKVILGSNGWLYYADTLPDYEGTASMSRRRLWNAAHTLMLMQEYAAGKGAEMVFTAVPNKNTLYPEQMPKRYEKSAAESNLQRLQTLLEEEQVAYCNLLEVLGGAEQTVYYRTDSHWDGYGSALAHDALLEVLGRDGALAEETFVSADHRGDLTDMLYPASDKTEQGRMLGRDRTFSYNGTIRGVDDMTIRTTGEAGSGSLLMFRDSFGNLLHADLAESFEAACFSRAMPYNLTWLEREQADTLIVEIVERNLPDLAQKPPVMEGPVRELDVPENTVAGSVELEIGKSGIENHVTYTGTIQCDRMDWNSPVFLVLDGTVYEATPAGETETSFALHAPQADDVAVLIYADGAPARIAGA